MSFSKELFTATWRPSSAELIALETYRSQFVEALIDFYYTVYEQPIEQVVPNINKVGKCNSDYFVLLADALHNSKTILSVARLARFPHAEILTPDWMHFKLFQVMLLQVCLLRKSYKSHDELIGRTAMRHEVHDLEYLLLGMHFQRLATRESSSLTNNFPKMGWKFRALAPRGLLLSE